MIKSAVIQFILYILSRYTQKDHRDSIHLNLPATNPFAMLLASHVGPQGTEIGMLQSKPKEKKIPLKSHSQILLAYQEPIIVHA
jgi:hypothetical protein